MKKEKRKKKQESYVIIPSSRSSPCPMEAITKTSQKLEVVRRPKDVFFKLTSKIVIDKLLRFCKVEISYLRFPH